MRDSASFRDPSGYVYSEDGEIFRRINPVYLPVYRKMIGSGLYKALVKRGMLLPHQEKPGEIPESEGLVIRPQSIPLISYPYEWSFGMLKDAALLTLQIHLAALDFGMILKDASAYNVQFIGCRPIFIDTLSFESYEDGAHWNAYGQFCRHFLAPLMLMRHTDIRLNQLLRVYPDGIPLDLADKLLHGRGGFASLVHIRWHAKAIRKHESDHKKAASGNQLSPLPLKHHIRLIRHLQAAIEKLDYQSAGSDWGAYHSHTSYSVAAASGKINAVKQLLQMAGGRRIWDFGANDGYYTRLALNPGTELAAAFDSDPDAVENNYRHGKKYGENILPLILDLNNPSGGIGFAAKERKSLPERGTPDCIMMLAVIHHLAISGNVPLDKIASWLAGLSPCVIIEFVPKEDPRVKCLLKCRSDIFPDYTRTGFEQAFTEFYQLEKRVELPDCFRTIYLFRRK